MTEKIGEPALYVTKPKDELCIINWWVGSEHLVSSGDEAEAGNSVTVRPHDSGSRPRPRPT